jgi:hypothetical protein
MGGLERGEGIPEDMALETAVFLPLFGTDFWLNDTLQLSVEPTIVSDTTLPVGDAPG